MLNRSGGRLTALRVAATGMVIGALASCGGNSAYTFNAPNSVVVADFNGDGYPDVAVASASIDQTTTNERPGYVAVILQNKSSPGSFQSPAHFSIDGNPSAMAAGQLGAPGSVDLAVANFNKGTISVLLETSPGSGTFQAASNLPTGGSPSGVAICDVNGDGVPDLLVSDGNTSTGGSLIIMLGTGSGKFAQASKVAQPPTYTGVSAPVPNAAYGLACGNLNGDGHSQDVVMTSFYTDASTGATYGGSGTLSIFFHDPNHLGGFLPRVDIPIAGLVRQVAIADVNHDGLPDIVVSNEGPGSDSAGTPGAVVLLQNAPATPGATPTFAAPVTYGSVSAVALAVADLNGDGYPDIVITSGYGGQYSADDVEVMMNSGTGTFGTPTSYSGFGNPASVAIGQLNGDTLPDIATADGTGAVVYMQNSSSPGTFQAGQLVGE
jgi:hypothetical protein